MKVLILIGTILLFAVLFSIFIGLVIIFHELITKTSQHE